MYSSRITVLCVDDHRIVREGIRQMIDAEPDMQVVAAVATGEEAVAFHAQHRPAITLMDLQLPGMNGVRAIEMIRAKSPGARIIVLTMYKGDEDIYRALAAGASTYLLKDALADELPDIVRGVHNGQRPLPADVAARLMERRTNPTLTTREIEVMELVAAGKRNKEIAAALAISHETVRVHVRNILAKLKVSDRTEAMSIAIRRGIIHIG